MNMKILPHTPHDIEKIIPYGCYFHLNDSAIKDNDARQNLYDFLVSIFFAVHSNDEVIRSFGDKTTTIGHIKKAIKMSTEEHLEFEKKSDDITVFYSPSSSLLVYVDEIYKEDILNFSAYLINKKTFPLYNVVERHNEIKKQKLIDLKSFEYSSVFRELQEVIEMCDKYKDELSKLGLTSDDIEKIETKAFSDYKHETLDLNGDETIYMHCRKKWKKTKKALQYLSMSNQDYQDYFSY